jgi:cullin-4
VYALSDAFTTGFKGRRSTPAEMIAKYLDKAMRHGQAGAGDEEFEALLDSVLGLHRFTDDKDVFKFLPPFIGEEADTPEECF